MASPGSEQAGHSRPSQARGGMSFAFCLGWRLPIFGGCRLEVGQGDAEAELLSFSSESSDSLILSFLFCRHGISILRNDTIENEGGVERRWWGWQDGRKFKLCAAD